MRFKWIGTVSRLSTQQQILSPKSAPGIPSGAYVPLIGAQQLEKKKTVTIADNSLSLSGIKQ